MQNVILTAILIVNMFSSFPLSSATFAFVQFSRSRNVRIRAAFAQRSHSCVRNNQNRC